MSPQVAALREAFVTLEEGTFVGAFIALASLETKRAHNYILVRGIFGLSEVSAGAAVLA